MTRERQEVKSDFGVPWKDPKVGETKEGKYLGASKVPNPQGTGYFLTHKILPDGADESVAIAGNMLGSKLKRVPVGTYVWITYKGEIKVKNGKAKDFQVECEKGTKYIDVVEDSGEPKSDDDIPF